jgi:translation initiation factor 5
MQKSVLVNISDVCRAIGRPPAHLVTFLGQQLGTSSKIDKDGKAFVGGAFTEGNIQELIFVFLRQYVRCHRGQAGRCNSIETECISEGTKKNRQLFLVCKSCGARTIIPNEERFAKFMLAHPPSASTFGHARGDDLVTNISAQADAAAAGEGSLAPKGAGGNSDHSDSWEDDWSDAERE